MGQRGEDRWGGVGNPDHDESIRIIHRALDAGINFIDTADVYSQGDSEDIVGKALAGGRRDDVILATKFHNPDVSWLPCAALPLPPAVAPFDRRS
jgi:aryl-alcohol dehydrogenase-like predicted oxidoreductase